MEETTRIHPLAKDKKQIVVLYGRHHWLSAATDYDFPENKAQNGKVKAMLPVEGRVRLNAGWKVSRVVLGGPNPPQLELVLSSGGQTAKYTKSLNDVFKIIDSQTVAFKFDSDWGDSIDISRFSIKTTLQMYLAFSIDVVGPQSIPQTVVILIVSGDPQISDTPSSKTIEPISIQWGCLAGDTKITMADGSLKAIADCKIGEAITTISGEKKGHSATIVNVYKGQEESLVHIVLENGINLRASLTHPIMTEEGYITAEHLNGGNKIRTLSGSQSIQQLYLEEYNNTVYSLELDRDLPLCANGILTGDFNCQNNLPPLMPHPEWSAEVMELREQMRAFTKTLVENSKNVF